MLKQYGGLYDEYKNEKEIWIQKPDFYRKYLFIGSSCRLEQIITPIPYHHMVHHTHNTKEFIQYLNYIKNNIDIPRDLEAKVFRSQFVKAQQGKDLLQIDKKKLLQEYSNSKAVVIEICSQKIYKKNNFYIHHLAADHGDITARAEKPSKVAKIQSKEELFNDLKTIKEMTSDKQLLIVSHINPYNFVKREEFIDQISQCCDKLNINFLNLSKIITKEHVGDPNHLNPLGQSVIKKVVLSKLKTI